MSTEETDKQIKESSLSNGGKPKSQWEIMMRKFSLDSKKHECSSCNYLKPLKPPITHPQPRSKTRFPSGSSYVGSWDTFGMSGRGVYTFSNGTVYKGEFDDGMFHGLGEMQYPGGITIRGKWRKGNLYEKTVVFADDTSRGEQDWSYCRKPDRRFAVEHKTGLRPAGQSILTADQPTRKIPEGFFDTGDGFYDPEAKNVHFEDMKAVLRHPNLPEQKWIEDHCRYSESVPVGPRADFYEEWMNAKLKPSSRTASVVGPDKTSSICTETASRKHSEPRVARKL